MKLFNTIVKLLTALATLAGIIYILATYGEQIVAWAKKTLAALPKCPCFEDGEIEVEPVVEEEAAEEAEAAPAEEEAAPEEAPVAQEEAVAEAPEVVVAENEPVAEEQDFAE